MITLLGCDGGLATFGAVLVRVYGNGVVWCEAAWAFDNPKSGTDVLEERRRRTRDLSRRLDDIVLHHSPDIVASEAMSFPRGAHAIAAICLAWGVVESVCLTRGVPLIAESPRAWRKALCPSGSERAAHRAALRKVPSFPEQVRRVRRGMQTHAYDALGVACWALTTRTVQDMLRERG